MRNSDEMGHDVEETHDARAELAQALDELKTGLDGVLAMAREQMDEKNHEAVGVHTNVTPDVGGALWELLRRMPGIIGNSLSGVNERVANARDTLSGLDGRLRNAGVDVSDRLSGYADRLADLREEYRHEKDQMDGIR